MAVLSFDELQDSIAALMPARQRIPVYEYNLGIRFGAVARQHASRTAIWLSPDETVSYSALNRFANRSARFLLAHGVVRHDVVCLSGEKSLTTFACMIGCLKIGAIYCVLDPDSPVARSRKILSTCKPKLLVAEPDLLHRLSGIARELAIETFNKDTTHFTEEIAAFEDGDLEQTHSVTGDDPAYIMFTSGSTGFPKGAVITHANILNLVAWSQETFSITPTDALTNVNPLYFDNSVFDFYAAILSGARLVPFSKADVTKPKSLVERSDAAGCTLWFSVPSLLIFLQTMKAADGTTLGSIRRFVFGGEGYPKAKLRLLYDAYAGQSEFYNVYGPTECSCICSCYKVTASDLQEPQGMPPLGHIANNFAFLILDANERAVAPGEAGELCLLGPNVGRGYYNDPARTADNFVSNPYSRHIREVMYKTGDLVTLDPKDGNLYFQGRRDNQVKHMGYRIELEEIEAALHCLEGVSEAAVIQTSVDGLSRLVAIVAAKDFDREPMRAALSKIIPSYMLPSVFHVESTLPKNANGKVDRRCLAERYGQPRS